MEGGDLEVTPESQDDYVGENVGLDYFDLDVCRLRCFGGTSGHWNGRCRALDALDFTPLRARALDWPIRKQDLDAYEPGAAEILDLTPFVPEPAPAVVAASGGELRTINWRRSAPTRFGEKYRGEIAASERITAGFNANLVDLRLDPALTSVTQAVFKSGPGDPGFAVTARSFCLCLGGLENPRLLLNANSQIREGIGNRNDLVGRYFCEHPGLRVARVVLKDRPTKEKYAFAPTQAFLEREELLNFDLLLEARSAEQARPLLQTLSATAQCLDPFTERLAREALGHWPRCRAGGIDEFLVRNAPREYPYGWVNLDIEQELQPASRVMLGEETDPFGLRRIRLDWRLSDNDYRAMKTAITTFGRYMAENDIGRVKLADWLLEESPVLPPLDRGFGNGSCHHMCTTRMSDDPATGVVDRDCRVHGMANLYIGGSSVFATPGFVNPTYTVVQLALRLSDHLAEGRHR